MWVSDFYMKYFQWLSSLTDIMHFFPNQADISAVPVVIIKLLLQAPFFAIVFFLPPVLIIRVWLWMIDRWASDFDDI